MASRDLDIKKLKDYFKKREDVVMAFLLNAFADISKIVLSLSEVRLPTIK